MKALLIWNNLWADRCGFILGSSDLPALRAEACFHPLCSAVPLLSFLGLESPHWLHELSVFLLWCFTFYQLIVSLFSITSPPTCSFCHTSFPYFHLSSLHFLQRWGCPMNNSEALRDDNGKLEVRLCVAGVCGRLADSFQPGGNRKRLFIHIIYVNKMTLLFKVSERGRVTTREDRVMITAQLLHQQFPRMPSRPSLKAVQGEKKRGPTVGEGGGGETRYMKSVARGPDVALCKCMCGHHKSIFVKLCG